MKTTRGYEVNKVRPRVVYIAGPYAAPDETTRLENVSRATQLALLASLFGYAPLVVHPSIEAGAYGDDNDLEVRERGLLIVGELCRATAAVGGACWVIARDDGSLSEGTKRDLAAYESAFVCWNDRLARRGHGAIYDTVIHTWAEWTAMLPEDLLRAP